MRQKIFIGRSIILAELRLAYRAGPTADRLSCQNLLGTLWGQTQVEGKLELIFKRIARWEAILLFDEADTFVASRGAADRDESKNALTSSTWARFSILLAV